MNNRTLYERAFEQSMKKYFGALEPSVARALLHEVEWVELLSGNTLIRTGEPADGMYILLFGRLSVFLEQEGQEPQWVGAVDRGESVGEMALLSGGIRNATVKASRDSVLAKISTDQFEALYAQYPSILKGFSQTVVTRLNSANQKKTDRAKPNIAVVPLQQIENYPDWVTVLGQFMGKIDQVKHINEQAVTLGLGKDVINPDDPEVFGWLAEADSLDAYSLYEGQPNLSPWTRKCVRQADKIYLLIDATGPEPDRALLDYLLDRRKRHPEAAYHLLIMHPPYTVLPSGTKRWLDLIQPDQFHHFRLGNEKDLRRISRLMMGKGIGIACGGGGAKGLAHIGMFKALYELGIETDWVAGTSIGAIMGATYALDWPLEMLMEGSRKTFIEGNITNDYQIPFYSLLRGMKKEKVLHELFDYQIEDLWRNFLCVSCNLSSNKMMVHERGSLWRAITASSALPGVFPPTIQDGQFLVDGALINNLPGDLLIDRGIDFLISVDVNISREIFTDQEHFPSNFATLSRKLTGRSKSGPRFPSLTQIFMRSSYLASTLHSQHVNRISQVSIQPPVKRIGLMGWDKLDLAIQEGYRSTIEYFQNHPDTLAFLQGETPSIESFAEQVQ